MAKNNNTPANPYKVGDIVSISFGYDMTLVEFYEVVRTTACKVELRQLEQTDNYDGFLYGTTIPVAGCYTESQEFKAGTLFKVCENGVIKIPYWPGCSSYHYATRWNGKPKYFNHCD